MKKNDKKTVRKPVEMMVKVEPNVLVSDIRKMINEARAAVAVTVNAGLTVLYWRIGKRIKEEVLKSKRAEYGDEILPTLSAKLTPIYGKGFKERNLARMIKFAECFPNEQILSTLSKELSWCRFHLKTDPLFHPKLTHPIVCLNNSAIYGGDVGNITTRLKP